MTNEFITTDCKIPINTVTKKILFHARDCNKGDLEWKDNYEFKDTLTFVDWGRGRGPTNFEFVDSFDNEYQMFMVDFCDMISKANINHGEVEGKWTFIKRGTDYGIKYLGK